MVSFNPIRITPLSLSPKTGLARISGTMERTLHLKTEAGTSTSLTTSSRAMEMRYACVDFCVGVCMFRII